MAHVCRNGWLLSSHSMHHMSPKHLPLFPCQKGKKGASVSSWAALQLWGGGGRELGRQVQGAVQCALKYPLHNPGQAAHQEARICSFYLTNYSRKSLAGAPVWALACLLDPLTLQKWCQVKQRLSVPTRQPCVGLAGLVGVTVAKLINLRSSQVVICGEHDPARAWLNQFLMASCVFQFLTSESFLTTSKLCHLGGCRTTCPGNQ